MDKERADYPAGSIDGQGMGEGREAEGDPDTQDRSAPCYLVGDEWSRLTLVGVVVVLLSENHSPVLSIG